MISEEEIEGDKCWEYFGKLCIWLSKHPSPKANDDNLQPMSPSNKRALTHETLEVYIGQLFKLVRTMFPNHRDWGDLHSNEYPK